MGRCIKLYSISYDKIYYIPYGFFIHASEGIGCLSSYNQGVGVMLVNMNDEYDSLICIINDSGKGIIEIVDHKFEGYHPFSRYKLINNIPSDLSFLPNEVKDIRVNEVVGYIKKIYSRRMRLIYEAGPGLFSKFPMYGISMRRLIRHYLNADKCIYYAQIKE